MTREEIHKNVLTIRNYYFSIQNKNQLLHRPNIYWLVKAQVD
jgi:hypothetical protein